MGIIDIGENFVLIHSDLMCHKILFICCVFNGVLFFAFGSFFAS